MTNTIEHSKTANHSEIAVVAYHMWEAAGQPANRDMQFWLDAEASLVAVKKLALKPALRVSPAASTPNSSEKISKVQPGFHQGNSSKSRQKSRWF